MTLSLITPHHCESLMLMISPTWQTLWHFLKVGKLSTFVYANCGHTLIYIHSGHPCYYHRSCELVAAPCLVALCTISNNHWGVKHEVHEIILTMWFHLVSSPCLLVDDPTWISPLRWWFHSFRLWLITLHNIMGDLLNWWSQLWLVIMVNEYWWLLITVNAGFPVTAGCSFVAPGPGWAPSPARGNTGATCGVWTAMNRATVGRGGDQLLDLTWQRTCRDIATRGDG